MGAGAGAMGARAGKVRAFDCPRRCGKREAGAAQARRLRRTGRAAASPRLRLSAPVRRRGNLRVRVRFSLSKASFEPARGPRELPGRLRPSA